MTREGFTINEPENNRTIAKRRLYIAGGIAIATIVLLLASTITLAVLFDAERKKIAPICPTTPLTTNYISTTTTAIPTTTPKLPFVVDESGCAVYQIMVDNSTIEYNTEQNFLEKKFVNFLTQDNSGNYSIFREEAVPGTFQFIRFNSSTLRCQARSVFPFFNFQCINNLMRQIFSTFYNDELTQVLPEGANDFVLLELNSNNPAVLRFGFRNEAPNSTLCAENANSISSTFTTVTASTITPAVTTTSTIEITNATDLANSTNINFS